MEVPVASSTPSLQDLCLYTLVQQLEHYPPECLACLPPTLRRMLLVHLPVVDICQLENTCVFDGIDTDSIWEHLYQQQIPRYFVSLEGFPSCSVVKVAKGNLEESHATFRERYLAILTHLILNRARPSGYFAAKRDYGNNVHFENPPPSIVAQAPVDIVNTLVAGERPENVNVAAKVEKQESANCEQGTDAGTDDEESAACEQGSDADTDGEDEEDIDWDAEYGIADVVITAVTDYDHEFQDRFLDSHCDHERGECFMDYCAYKETNEACQYVPPRYHSSYTPEENCHRLSDKDALNLLVTKCNYRPKYMFVSVTAYNSKCWDTDLLSQLLWNVRSLQLSFDGYVEGVSEMKEILTAILSNPRPLLSTLDLRSDTELECYDEDDNLVTDKHLSQLSEVSSLHTLKELSIYGMFTADGLSKLGSIIDRQLVLDSLSVHSFAPNLSDYRQRYDDGEYSNYHTKVCICCRPFVESLVSYFHNPSFQRVSLRNVTFPLNMLQDVIVGFLTSPSTDIQSLKLKSVVLEKRDDVVSHRSAVEKRSVPESAFQNKSLEVSIKELELTPDFSSWLCSLLPLKLKHLNISCYDHSHMRSIINPNKFRAHDDYLPILVRTPSTQVQSLSLCQPGSISVEAVRLLVQNDSLKYLELKFCSGVIDFTNLAEHLLKQLPMSTLEQLKVEDGVCENNDHISLSTVQSRARPYSDESITLFSDALFSLPCLGRLALEISLGFRLNHNIPQLIKLMYESWKRNGERRLRKFILSYGEALSEDTVQMSSEMGLVVYIV